MFTVTGSVKIAAQRAAAMLNPAVTLAGSTLSGIRLNTTGVVRSSSVSTARFGRGAFRGFFLICFFATNSKRHHEVNDMGISLL